MRNLIKSLLITAVVPLSNINAIAADKSMCAVNANAVYYGKCLWMQVA